MNSWNPRAACATYWILKPTTWRLLLGWGGNVQELKYIYLFILLKLYGLSSLALHFRLQRICMLEYFDWSWHYCSKLWHRAIGKMNHTQSVQTLGRDNVNLHWPQRDFYCLPVLKRRTMQCKYSTETWGILGAFDLPSRCLISLPPIQPRVSETQ